MTENVAKITCEGDQSPRTASHRWQADPRAIDRARHPCTPRPTSAPGIRPSPSMIEPKPFARHRTDLHSNVDASATGGALKWAGLKPRQAIYFSGTTIPTASRPRDARTTGKLPRSAYCETAVPELWNTTRVGGAIWLTTGSTTTAATPTRFISSASAARGERSRMRPRPYGPRSLILTRTARPLPRFVTFA